MNRNKRTEYAVRRSSWRLRLLAVVACIAAMGGTVFAEEEETPSAKGRIESMTPAERYELGQRHERFAALEPGEQEELRRLHDRIERDPDSSELRRVMSRYYEWLKTLPPYVRAELSELPMSERVERIREIRDEERRQQAKRLGPDDADVLRKWMESIATRYEDKIIGALPEPMRQRVNGLDGPMRRWAIMGALWMRWQSGNSGKSSKMPPIPERDLAELRSKLSAPARGSLESLPPTDQWRMISGWIRQVTRHGQFGQRPGNRDPSKTDEELAKFFEHELTAKQRDRLLALPAEQMQQELWRMYTFRQKGSEALPWGPGDPRRGKRGPFDSRHGPPRFNGDGPPNRPSPDDIEREFPPGRPPKPEVEKRKDAAGRRKPVEPR